MKIKKIISLCKASGIVILFFDEKRKIQWLSDGEAAYPLAGVPMFDEDTFCNTFEINDSQRRKLQFKINTELPAAINFEDADNLETEMEKQDITVTISSLGGVAFKTEYGLEFVENEYLLPFSDYESRDLRFFIRETASGTKYIAVKNGFMLLGIILPMKIISKQYLDDLKKFTKEVELTLYNSDSGKDEPQQLEMMGDIENE